MKLLRYGPAGQEMPDCLKRGKVMRLGTHNPGSQTQRVVGAVS